ncbi:MAG: hypothetical protein ACRDWH_05100 [Acidimicrobiia bacterium]
MKIFPLAAVAMLTVTAGCTASGATTTTTHSGIGQSSEVVAAEVLDALAAGDAELAADMTVEEQMAWLAMAEGASLQDAAGLLDEGAREVAVNYWTGFTQSAAVPPVAIASVDETRLGDHLFAVVQLGGGGDLRLVLRSEPDWRVDVVASFGSTLAARLADAVQVVTANRGEGGDALRALMREQRDSVEMAALDPSLNDDAVEALVNLAEALDLLGS